MVTLLRKLLTAPLGIEIPIVQHRTFSRPFLLTAPLGIEIRKLRCRCQVPYNF